MTVFTVLIDFYPEVGFISLLYHINLPTLIHFLKIPLQLHLMS